MCTVSFLPKGENNFILTSNRDESPGRKTIPPKAHQEKGGIFYGPTDSLAGGTWIGLNDKKRLACLLNGGFKKHKWEGPYRKSRGIVVKELLLSIFPLEYIKKEDFKGVEPFTLLLFDWNRDLLRYQFVWDGLQKHINTFNHSPKIWSSSTLYDEKIKIEREAWFEEWHNLHPNYELEDILEFHHSKNLGSKATSLIMDRVFVKTVSISSVVKCGDSIRFIYEDLRDNSKHFLSF